MLADRIVEPDEASVAKLHQGDAGEELRDRANAVEGGGQGWNLARDVGVTRPTLPEQFLVVDHRRRNPWELFVSPFGIDPLGYQRRRLLDPRMIGELGGGGRCANRGEESKESRVSHELSPG